MLVMRIRPKISVKPLASRNSSAPNVTPLSTCSTNVSADTRRQMLPCPGVSLRTVGVMSPGDMGHGLGRVLAHHGLRVVAALDGRSERTRRLAAEAGIADVGSFARLVGEADLVLSVLVPDQALAAAERVADAIR